MSQRARWISYIDEFQFDIAHRQCVTHGNADTLSLKARRSRGSNCWSKPEENYDGQSTQRDDDYRGASLESTGIKIGAVGYKSVQSDELLTTDQPVESPP